ncbi:cyclic nucleotide-binding domain-containing protein, partial [bacterium]|nr:cyclic nucleotide-binding domain-containing protein [bacterium]
MTENIKQVLLDIIVFHALSDSEIDILLKKVKYIEYKTDDIIFKEDDMGSEMFVILEGKVDVLKHDLDGDDHLIISLYENDSFGE